MNFIGFIVVILSSVLVVTGCSKNSKSGSTGVEDVFFNSLWSEPGDIHPLRASDSYSRQAIMLHPSYISNVAETLIGTDLNTYESIPWLAEKWEISEDGKEFTFFLRKGVKFHDGSEMTAEDVKFSYDAIFNDLYEAYVKRSYFDNFKSVEILDKYTVKFTAKSTYFLNLDTLGSLLYIVPKSFYSKQTKDKRFAKTVMGTGAYKFQSWKKGKSLTVVANEDWWGRNVEGYKDLFKLKKIVFKFVKESSLRRAMLERGTLDYDQRVRPEEFVKKMTGKMWGNSVLKVKAQNNVPKTMTYIGLNNNHPVLKDKAVRKALAHFVNRPFLIERFFYGLMEPATGPFRVGSKYIDPQTKPIPFDVKKGKEILTKAGWSDSNKDGVLDKVIDGKLMNLEFSLLSANKDSEKILTVIKEDMKKAGVNMKINIIDWNALIKAMDERKFDATILSWGGGGVHPDPTQLWHSKSAVGVGSNYISYKNTKVDKLIEDAVLIADENKRAEKFHLIHRMIAEDAPYIFLYEEKYNLYAVSARVVKPKDTFKYSTGPMYWSLPSQ